MKNSNKKQKENVNGISTPYATAYTNGTDTRSGILIYKIGKAGDGTKEVYKGSGDRSWFSDYDNSAGSDDPFFMYGGGNNDTGGAGVFFSHYYPGGVDYNVSFRVVLGQ